MTPERLAELRTTLLDIPCRVVVDELLDALEAERAAHAATRRAPDGIGALLKFCPEHKAITLPFLDVRACCWQARAERAERERDEWKRAADAAVDELLRASALAATRVALARIQALTDDPPLWTGLTLTMIADIHEIAEAALLARPASLETP